MRILIDLQACQNGSAQRGIGRVALELTRAIAAAPGGHDIRILLSDAFPGTILPLRRALSGFVPQDHILVCAMPGRTASADAGNAWRTRAAELLLADVVAAQAPDLLLLPSLFEGFWDAVVTSVEPARYRTAVLLHDFIPLDEADIYLPVPGIRAAYHRKMRAAATADLLLTNSHFIAGEAVAKLGVPASRVVATPLGVDASFRPPSADADWTAIAARHGIERPFVLNTSGFEHRKNLEGLIAGFAAMPAPLVRAHQLVIVGRMDASARRALAAAAATAGLPDGTLVLPGFVPDADLVALYGSCALFAFPSFSEGFGLPVLEAMACGAPVIGSATTSIPEVIGRDDLLCDPADPQAIGAAMARVLGDATLTAELRDYGPARARQFSWTHAAELALAAFARLPARVVPPAPTRPIATRPSLALVADAIPVAQIGALAFALDGAFAVTPVVGGGAFEDPLAAAHFEVRDLAWFERHAPGFDRILYAASESAGPLHALIDAFPGALLLLDGDPGRPEGRARDLLAVGGFAALAGAGADPPRGEALARKATARITTKGLPDDRTAIADRLRDVVLADVAGHEDARGRFAAALPQAVRDVRPSADDLAALARAFAANAAHRRSPRILLDVSNMADAPLDPARRALLVALFAAAGREARGVRATEQGWTGADRRIATALGIAPDPFDDEALPLRADDRLIAVDLLGGASEAREALAAALEAGAVLAQARFDGAPASAAQAAELLIRWLSAQPATMQGESFSLDVQAGNWTANARAAPSDDMIETAIYRATIKVAAET